MEQSIQTCQHKVPDQFEIDFENAFSKISIIPNYPLLKHLSPNSPPNMPTRYETVGIACLSHLSYCIAQIWNRKVKLKAYNNYFLSQEYLMEGST